MEDVIAVTTLAIFKYLMVTLLSMTPPGNAAELWLTTCNFARECEV